MHSHYADENNELCMEFPRWKCGERLADAAIALENGPKQEALGRSRRSKTMRAFIITRVSGFTAANLVHVLSKFGITDLTTNQNGQVIGAAIAFVGMTTAMVLALRTRA
jgi:hypothetical protein